MRRAVGAAPARQEARRLARAGAAPTSVPTAGRAPTHLPLWLLGGLAAFLLLVGAGTSPYDALEYQCYALAFWRGGRFAVSPPAICSLWLGHSTAPPFHLLPQEYGPLALLPFSLPAIGPRPWYFWLFAVEMLLVVAGIAWVLVQRGRPGSAHAWLFYAMLGSMVTALGRLDVVTGGCVLLALIALKSDRQALAYGALAAGTLLKFYPLALAPLFLIETWRARRIVPWWRGPAVYAGLVVGVEGIAALLDPAGILAPLTFMSQRCVEIESLPATLSYLWARLTGGRASIVFADHALCQSSPGIDLASGACTLLALAGIAAVVWLFWRGRANLPVCAILILCLTMLGSKVFSPQYLLWVSPLVAWEYGLQSRVFLAWSAVCAATTLIFPLSYFGAVLVALHTTSGAVIPLTAGARNLMLAALVCGALWRLWWLRPRSVPESERTLAGLSQSSPTRVPR